MNGGDSVSWAKKPAVPDNRKRAVSKKTIEQLSAKKYCQKCSSRIRLIQINFKEALWMCENVDCTFMPSSNWESLVVKRDISQISSVPRKKGPFSSSSSASSYNSDNSIHSAPQIKGFSRSAPHSLCGHLSEITPQSSAKTLPHHTLSAIRPKKSDPSQTQRLLVSPTPSQEDSASGDRERKTLVPIAPFLCGHAHSFSSFETNKLINKIQPKSVQIKTLAHQIQKKVTSQTVSASQSDLARGACFTGSKRRPSSLDSDSVSSDSSLDSCVAPANLDETCSESFAGKKVRRITVPSDTFAKLLNGSLKLDLVKATKGDVNETVVVIKPVIEKNPSYSSQIAPSYSKINTVPVSTTLDTQIKVLKGLEITPVGSVEDISGSGNFINKLDALNVAVPSSIKSHIDAINLHLKAIKSISKEENYKSVKLVSNTTQCPIQIMNNLEDISKGDKNLEGNKELFPLISVGDSFTQTGYTTRSNVGGHNTGQIDISVADTHFETCHSSSHINLFDTYKEQSSLETDISLLFNETDPKIFDLDDEFVNSFISC